MKSNGLATILLMIPVLAIPALAIFGIPQFAPVVASPLDEGRGKDNEFHVGNSARQSHDELFADLEDIGAEPAAKEDALTKRRASAVTSGGNRRAGTRQLEESAAHGWGDDTLPESEWPSKSHRQATSASAEATGIDDADASGMLENRGKPKKLLASAKSNRSVRHDLREAKVDDAIRVAAATDIDPGIVQAEFADGEIAKPQVSPQENRSRFDDSARAKRRESAAGPLTWQSVQQRLNELEIRNFRLEPGHQPGQFVFICSYTPPDNPRVSYRFEAAAEEPLRAVEKVLEQIVQWRQLR